ncbi:MAG: hypothetical protein EA376_01875 [Phycisphaeraceae bacterium]|nr:MAG: hypothetical protein EA376_01875 [Phycisphaeraceae bacterium]
MAMAAETADIDESRIFTAKALLQSICERLKLRRRLEDICRNGFSGSLGPRQPNTAASVRLSSIGVKASQPSRRDRTCGVD